MTRTTITKYTCDRCGQEYGGGAEAMVDPSKLQSGVRPGTVQADFLVMHWGGDWAPAMPGVRDVCSACCSDFLGFWHRKPPAQEK